MYSLLLFAQSAGQANAGASLEDAAIVLANVVLAFCALFAAMVSYYSLRCVIDPQLVVVAEPQPFQPQNTLILVRNIGRGVATNVTLHFPDGFTVGVGMPSPRALRTEQLVYLGPGQEHGWIWGTKNANVFASLPERRVLIRVSYDGENIGPFGAKHYETSFELDPRSTRSPVDPFRDAVAPAIVKMEMRLQDIHSTLSNWGKKPE